MKVIYIKAIILTVIFNGETEFVFSQSLNPFSKNNGYVFSFIKENNIWPSSKKSYHWGYKDSTGNTIIKAKFQEARLFHEDRAIVKLHDFYGVINPAGEWIVRPKYEEIGDYSEGYAYVKTKNGYGFVNKEGDEVIKPLYTLANSFNYGVAKVYNGIRFNFINKQEEPIIKDWGQYDFIQDFSEGLAVVEKSNRFRYIDNTGKIVISLKYQAANPFSNAKALVKENEKYGYINKFDEWVISPQFEHAAPFINDIAIVKKNGATVCYKGQYCCLDTLGQVHNFNDSLFFFDVDIPPLCKYKNIYTSTAYEIPFPDFFYHEMLRSLNYQIDLDFRELKINIFIDEKGYCFDYEILKDFNNYLKYNTELAIKQSNKNTIPASKDGTKVPIKISFSIKNDCETLKDGTIKCAIITKINSIQIVNIIDE